MHSTDEKSSARPIVSVDGVNFDENKNLYSVVVRAIEEYVYDSCYYTIKLYT